MINRYTIYRTVSLETFLEPNSQHWFYRFPFEWVWYRSNQGWGNYSDAREAGENHIDTILENRGLRAALS